MVRPKAARIVSAVLALVMARAEHLSAGSVATNPAVVTRGGGGRSGEYPGSTASKSVSIFGPEEKELDRYSAALAGTHFLRQERDKIIKDTMNPIAHLYLRVTKRDQYNRWMSSPWVSDEARQAQKNYLVQAGNVIRSNGLSTARYNELSHMLRKQADLRKRVEQQAYLYRVSANLRGDKMYALEELQEGEARSGGHQVAGGETEDGAGSTRRATVQFAKSLREIESLRLGRTKRLMRELGCDELPPGICRPSMGRLAPRFRKACEQFPLEAEGIVRANGLGVEEFNRLSARTRGNAFYRWRVLRCVREVDREARKV